MIFLYRSFLIFLFLLINIELSHAQTTFGVKAGMNASTGEFKPYQEENLNYIIRYHAGLLAEIKIYKKFFIKPELLYSNKGWNTSTTYFNKGVNVSLHYLNIPVLAGYTFNEYVSVLAGPEFGYLLRSDRTPGGKVNDFFQKYDLGLSGGMVINFASRFGIEFRYIHGFKGLLKNVTMTDEFGVPTFTVDKAGSNRVFQISTRYRLNNL